MPPKLIVRARRCIGAELTRLGGGISWSGPNSWRNWRCQAARPRSAWICESLRGIGIARRLTVVKGEVDRDRPVLRDWHRKSVRPGATWRGKLPHGIGIARQFALGWGLADRGWTVCGIGIAGGPSPV